MPITIYGVVTEIESNVPIAGAEVTISKDDDEVVVLETTKEGKYSQGGLVSGKYQVQASAFGTDAKTSPRGLTDDYKWEANLSINLHAQIAFIDRDGNEIPEASATEGQEVTLTARIKGKEQNDFKHEWSVTGGSVVEQGAERNKPKVHWNTTGLLQGDYAVTVIITGSNSPSITLTRNFTIRPRQVQASPTVPVTMRRTATTPTTDLPLWLVIRNTTEEIGFNNYFRFMDYVLCGTSPAVGDVEQKNEIKIKFENLERRRALPYNDADAYRLLKVATEAFLMVKCGVALPHGFTDLTFTSADLNEVIRRVSLDPNAFNLDTLWKDYLRPAINGHNDSTIPYLALVREKLGDVRLKHSFFAGVDARIDLPHAEQCFGILRSKLISPCLLELIWSYWHEEGMLVQTLNAIGLRFQNIRSTGDRDPLTMLEIDPLRPLNNLIWGYIQDEQHRLTVVRRAYEYDHHYGLTLQGKAVPALRTADSRSKFLEAFHNLLYLCWLFFKEDDDTTVIADGFPVLNALKEVHLLLAEGAHNQFGDLPSTARQEMLIQQWLLARPEFREFLPTRIMVAYPEPWMDRVDAMKRLQAWTDVSVREFHDLGVHGERILLSIRFGAWLTVDDPVQATNWARFWRQEIQGYIHSYRAVTGVDLTTEITDARQAALRSTQPSMLLRQRLALQPGQQLALQRQGVPMRR